jgi:LPXTG-motif cell wall-anchored protein
VAQSTNSSAVPTLVAVAVVAVLLAGGALFALRRRRLQ